MGDRGAHCRVLFEKDRFGGERCRHNKSTAGKDEVFQGIGPYADMFTIGVDPYFEGSVAKQEEEEKGAAEEKGYGSAFFFEKDRGGGQQEGCAGQIDQDGLAGGLRPGGDEYGAELSVIELLGREAREADGEGAASCFYEDSHGRCFGAL